MIYLTKLPEAQSRRERSAAERRASWALLRFALSREMPTLAGAPLREMLTVGSHGKPYLKGNARYFNLSHSGGLVACATGDREVGVDVEGKRQFSARLKRRICTPGELSMIERADNEDEALTSLWTMKESYMKYTGLGFAQGILATEFTVLGERPVLKSGDACFACADLGEAYLTLCSETPPALDFLRIRPEELEPFLSESIH